MSIGGLAIRNIPSSTPPPIVADYYVDFVGGSDSNAGTSTAAPWKRAPGMTNATGTAAATTLQPGDIIVFKGGVTWTTFYPWSIHSGSSGGGHVTYTVDESWYTGGSYTPPVFNGGNSAPTGGLVVGSSDSYFTLDGLKFIETGTSGTYTNSKTIVCTNCHDLKINNCTFIDYTRFSISITFTSAGSYSEFEVSGNDVSATSALLWFTSAAANINMHNLTMANNDVHDFSSQIVGDVHGDGLLHYFSVPANDSTQYLDGMMIYNNRFYGDFRKSDASTAAMTAFIFTEGSASGYIFNNVFSYTPAAASIFGWLVAISGNSNAHTDTLGIYNNSFACIGTSAMSSAFYVLGLTGSDTLTFKNNIIYTPNYAINLDSAGSVTAYTGDKNVLTSTSGELVANSSFQSYATWQAAGRDVNSVLGDDPEWVAAPGNEHLGATSPAIDAGENLTSLGITALNVDRDGVARPSSGAWDAGAYQQV